MSAFLVLTVFVEICICPAAAAGKAPQAEAAGQPQPGMAEFTQPDTGVLTPQPESADQSGETGSSASSQAPASPSAATGYTARFDLADHPALLGACPDGLFHPEAGISRGEVCRILYMVLDGLPDGACSFADVPEGSPYYSAVAALTAAGVFNSDPEGNFGPGDFISRAQFIVILGRLCDSLWETSVSFEDIAGHWAQKSIENAVARGWISDGTDFRPDDRLTRAEFCSILDGFMGRRTHEDAALVSSTAARFSDVPPSYWAFADITECASEGEYYDLEPGFHYSQGKLYYVVNEDTILRNCDYEVWHFGDDGYYTTGDAQLDKTLRGILCSLVTDDMSSDERLRTVYLYLKDNFSYKLLPFSVVPSYGETGFENTCVKGFFEKGWGVCYNFSSAFCLLARSLGYEAYAIAGAYHNHDSDDTVAHSFTIIPQDGVDYFYDPQVEITHDFPDFLLYGIENYTECDYYYDPY